MKSMLQFCDGKIIYNFETKNVEEARDLLTKRFDIENQNAKDNDIEILESFKGTGHARLIFLSPNTNTPVTLVWQVFSKNKEDLYLKQINTIRKDTDGNVVYGYAKEILDLCLNTGLLRGIIGDYILCIIGDSDDFEIVDYEKCIQDLMENSEGLNTLLDALSKIGEVFTPQHEAAIYDAMHPLEKEKNDD